MTTGPLLVFIDQAYWREGERVSTNDAFLLFIQSFVPELDRILFLGRLHPDPGEAPYSCLPHPRFEFRQLPYYSSLHHPGHLLLSLPAGLRTAWKAVGDSQAALLGIPNPWSLALRLMCSLRGRPAVFLVRQDLLGRVRLRPPGPRRTLALIGVRFLESAFLRFARRTLTFTVGSAMLERYRRSGGSVHPVLISLVPAAAVEAARARVLPPPDVPRRLLCVGRLHPDKGLDVLLDAMRALPDGLRLELAGDGPMEADLRRLAERLDVGRRVRFHGYVPFGPRLEALYREASLFVLPSDSEGFPQVILEAGAAALPIVATAVGGMATALRDGVEALLVPPRDPGALAAAIARVTEQATLYRRLSEGALSFARRHTLEAERERMLRLILAAVSGGEPDP